MREHNSITSQQRRPIHIGLAVLLGRVASANAEVVTVEVTIKAVDATSRTVTAIRKDNTLGEHLCNVQTPQMNLSPAELARGGPS